MLKIGWCEKDISTDKPVGIGGQFYLRVSKGVLDSLTTTALTVENNGEYAIFVECDMVTIPNGILKAIQEKVSEKNSEIDTSKIILNATHTHTSPILDRGNQMGKWGDISKIPHDGIEITSPGEYTEFFVEQVSSAICESYESRNNGQIAYGYGYAAVAHSRRVVYSKSLSDENTKGFSRFLLGNAKMYGNTNEPNFSHYEAGSDHYANFMFTFDKDEKLTGAIINVPCPSQNCEVEWYLSGDFWHDVKENLRKEFGDIFILPQCAAAGDLAPRTMHYRVAEQRRYRLKYPNYKPQDDLIDPYQMWHRKDIALRICDSFSEVLSWAKNEKINDAVVLHTTKLVELERRLVTDEEYACCKASSDEMKKNLQFVNSGNIDKDFEENTLKIRNANNFDDIIERYEVLDKSKTHKTEIHAVRIGDIAFCSNQFELYMDFQHRIQARSPFVQTFIVQLTGQPHCEAGSYLATERAVEGKGYSAFVISNIVTAKGGQQLVEETLTELNKLLEN